MGLLDALFQNDSGGGLLDFLRTTQQPPDYGQAANVPVGNYSMPVFGSAGAVGQPQSVPQQPPPVIPAQAAQPQFMPPQMQPQSQGIGDRLMTGLQSFAHGNVLDGIQGFNTGQRTDPLGVAELQSKQAQNMTAQALRKRGVSEEDIGAALGNPEMLNTLIKQTYGPQTVQSLGEGYIYNPKTGKTERAYTPEDKTPNSVLEYKFYQSNVPKGTTPLPFDKWLQTKDSDPNAVHVLGRDGELYKVDASGNPVIVHKNETKQDATLDDPTTSAMASQYLAGDKSVMQNLGRGAQGAANIVKLRTEIYNQATAQGLNGKDIVNNFNEQAGALAGQRAVGTRAANISLAANEANNMIPIALAASDKLPRTQYMPWNQMVQTVQKGTSSPELASFVAATNSLVNSYVRAVSPSGVPTDSMREHAYSMLNAAQGPEAYKAVVATMQQEMKAALQAPAQVRSELRTGNTDAPKESQGKAGDEIYANARAAIAKGAPREKVLERLRQNGVDPSGL